MKSLLRSKFVLVLLALVVASAAYAATFKSDKVLYGSANLAQPTADFPAQISCTYEIATAIADGDVYEMCPLPANVTVTDVMVVMDDLDGGTVLTMDLGYGSSTAYFASAATTPRTGGVLRATAATAFPLTLTAKDTIDIHMNGTAASGGTGTVNMTVTYIGKAP